MAAYDISVGGSYAILYVVMIGFTLLALVASSYIPVPDAIGSFLVASSGKTTVASGDVNGDFFLSARNSANARTVAMSFFAGGMGAWVVYGTSEMGANPKLSWLGMIGYSAASAFPGIIIGIIGPKVRERSGENSFTAIDFAYERFGTVMQVVVSIVSVFYMFIYIVAELTSIANVYSLLAAKDEDSYKTLIALSMCAFTVFYTSIGGVPASIVTDKFQAGIIILLVVILFFAVLFEPENSLTKQEYDAASSFTMDGFMALVTLFIAIASAELFNQSTWQRVWAAESGPALRRGYFYATIPIFLTMMFFGIMGQIAYAKDPDGYNTFQKLPYLSFFDILTPLSTFWHSVVLILVTAFAASSIDSLQTGIVGIFSTAILSCFKGSLGKWSSRILLVVINIAAVVMSTKGYDVIPLFLVADLACATTVLPLFFGLMEGNWYLIRAPTELGSVLGSISGVGTVLVNGAILNFDQAVKWDGTVLGTGPFSYFWLTNGAQCALCGSKTMITFIVTPLVAGFFTLFFSMLDVMIRGEENARKPLLHSIFPRKNEELDEVVKVKEELAEKAVIDKDEIAEESAKVDVVVEA